MRDSEMFNILSNLGNSGKTKKVVTEDVNNDTAIKANPETTMRNLLEVMEPTAMSRRLDESSVKSVGPRLKGMPGTHNMAKAGKKKHPANRFLVGGEEGDVPAEADAQLDEMGGEADWGDEVLEALKIILQQQEPEDVGAAVQDLIDQYADDTGYDAEPTYNDYPNSEDGDYATMSEGRGPDDDDTADDDRRYPKDDTGYDTDDDISYSDEGEEIEETFDPASGTFVKKSSNPYQAVTEEDELDEDTIGMKQSFSDVFRSMEESDEESSSRLEKELFTELDEPVTLKKNEETGKYDLNDSINEDDLEEGWNSERDAFKRQEQNAGLEQEDYVWNQQPHTVYFDGRPWKSFDGKQKAQNIARSMMKKGKTGITIGPTK